MRAAWYEQFGAAKDVLEVGERPDPEPGPGEVLVALSTSAVNPSDVRKRAGQFPNLLDAGPIIPHSDGAGVVEAVGEHVDPDRIGQRVWVYQGQHVRREGTAASLIAIDGARAIPLPDSVDFVTGACLGIPAMTAHRCVFADGPVSGTTVLVTGGAGRVGHMAIQWASQAGARVIATASNAADADACRQAGAEAVVNHREPGWAEQVVQANDSEKVDRVIDLEFGVNLDSTLAVLRVGGAIAAYGSIALPEPRVPFYRMMYLDLLLRTVIVYEMPESAKTEAVHDIDRALNAGWLKPRVGARLPLEEVAGAHELIEQGAVRGSVVLEIE
jgi:NADPH:quinone reductase-like Zn-dependent oxidoreductase